jgi:ribose 5-phosphate isomerase B
MSQITDSELQSIVRKVVEEKLLPSKTVTSPQLPLQSTISERKTVAIGSDHGGFSLKESLKSFLQESGFALIDCGTNDKNAVDYPDFAHAVAQLVAKMQAWRGIMIDGAGIGSCMTANKVPGIRASMCYDLSTASNAREHNDANVLTLGAGLIGDSLAKQIVKTWLTTEFGGGRHTQRIEKITQVEKQYLK